MEANDFFPYFYSRLVGRDVPGALPLHLPADGGSVQEEVDEVRKSKYFGNYLCVCIVSFLPRLTAVMGGLVTALGCLFTSFASQFHQLFLSYGIMMGNKYSHKGV